VTHSSINAIFCLSLRLSVRLSHGFQTISDNGCSDLHETLWNDLCHLKEDPYCSGGQKVKGHRLHRSY